MESRTIGPAGLTVSAVGLGCMGMSAFYGPRDDAESTATIRRALDLGVSLLDTADLYGPWTNERLLGRAVAGRRDEVVIATKCGQEIDEHGSWTRRMNGRPDYVRRCVDGSLERLGVETIDLFYLHRVDPDVPVEESFGALGEAVAAGKVRALGICEAAPDTIRRAHAIAPLSAVQTEYSLFTRDVEHNGVLDVCAELGIGFVGYAPLGRGVLTGRLGSLDGLADDDIRRASPRFQAENLGRNLAVVEEVGRLATSLGATPGQLALAWLLARGPSVVAIPGTRRIGYLEENAAAADLRLGVAELARLDELAPPGVAAGQRYTDDFLRTTYR
ncbi:MAG: aldo/keto reductase [Nocardioidaceae bacterium]|nr:aldo/keto reductase [Nocardioidaceae bacterium]